MRADRASGAGLGRRKQIGLLLLLYALLCLPFTYPIPYKIDRAVLGWPGDNLEYVWKMWWFKHALIDERVTPYFVPDVYAPFGLNMAYAEMTPSHTVLGLPFTMLFGETVSYNLAILLSFILSGLGTCLLVEQITGSLLAGAIAGTAFAFSPYRIAHLPGHLPLMGTQWLPFTLYWLERLRHRPKARYALGAGICFALFSLSSWYYAAFGIIVLGVYVPLRFLPWKKWLLQKKTWGYLVVFGLAVALMLAPFVIPYLRSYQSGALRHSLADVDAGSANLTDFVVPNLQHPLWGAWIREKVPFQARVGVEKSLYLGLLTGGLACLGIVVWRKSPVWRPWLALFAVSILLALGPTLHWRGESLGIPLPARFLYRFVPPYSSIRVWARFGLITIFATSVLSGLGAKWVLDRVGRPKRRFVVASILVLLIVFDFAALPPGWTRTAGRAVDHWLAEQPSKFTIIEFPLERSIHGAQMYYTIVHQKRIAHGYGTFIPPEFRAYMPRLSTFPSADSLEVLKGWDIEYILVNTRAYRDRWPEMLRQLEASPLVFVQEIDRIHVYRLAQEKPKPKSGERAHDPLYTVQPAHCPSHPAQRPVPASSH